MAFVAERAANDTQTLEVAGSKPIRSKDLLLPGIFQFFLISFFKAAFCRVFASVRKAKLRV